MSWKFLRFALLAFAAAPAFSVEPTPGPAALPAAGAQAPDFTLSNAEGKPTSLKSFLGKWVVLYFYPKDFTGGCTIEAHNFQRDLPKYQQAGAVIVGVSVDSAESHKQFCAKEGLGFTLLSDPEAKVTTAYGSAKDYQGSKLAARNTFLIDPQGKIVKVYTGVNPSTHSEEILTALASLKG